MKIQELKKILPIALKDGKMPVLMLGSPGIGKSEIINQIGDDLGYDVMVETACTADPCDYKGLPAYSETGGAAFFPYGNLLRMINAVKPLIVFFDDLGWAPPSVINAVCHLIQAREINGHKISDHVRFIAASNRRKDNSNVTGLSKALTSRFSLIVEFECDAESWITWAFTKNLSPEIISFITRFPDKLCNFDPANKEIEAFACPRSIYALSKWLQAGVIDFEVFKGVVGPAFAADFLAFYKIYKGLGDLPEKALKDPHNARIPDEIDIRYALLIILSFKAKEDNIDNLFIYLSRLPEEFQAFAVKCIVTKNKKLEETTAMINWYLTHADNIV